MASNAPNVERDLAGSSKVRARKKLKPKEQALNDTAAVPDTN